MPASSSTDGGRVGLVEKFQWDFAKCPDSTAELLSSIPPTKHNFIYKVILALIPRERMFLATKRFDPEVEEQSTKRPKIVDDVHDKQRQILDQLAPATDAVESTGQNDQVSLEIDPKHAGLLSKFKASFKPKKEEWEETDSGKTAVQKEPAQEEEDVIIRDAPVAAELIPLPQPKPVSSKKIAHSDIPRWMAKPTYIPADSSCSFEEFALSSNTLKNLTNLGFQQAFAVQTKVIGQFMDDIRDKTSPDRKRDILVNSFTGSGKTLAYSIPLVEALKDRVVPRVRALIIVPTRPLTQQVRGVIESLSKGTSLRTLVLRTDRPFSEEQKLLESYAPDIIVTTPGRLVDHVQTTPTFDLKFLKYLVIDEADRLLNQSFQEWVSVVMKAIPNKATPPQRPVQKLIFSATLTRDPGKLASLNIGSYSRVFIVGDRPDIDLEFTVPDTLTEKVISYKSTTNKPLILLQILAYFNMVHNTLIFAKSNEAAARLARLLTLMDEEAFSLGIKVAKCTGEMDVASRRKCLRQFGQGEIGILVCTDLIARGIDIPSVENVINYDLPIGKREYVHRVGRTARAGASGTAWTLVGGKGEKRHFHDMTSSIFRNNDIEEIDSRQLVDQNKRQEQEQGYEKALSQLEEEVYH